MHASSGEEQKRPVLPFVVKLAVITQRTHTAIEEHAHAILRDTGLTLPRYRLLLEIQGTELSVEALACRLSLHRTSVRTTLEHLERQGLVECARRHCDGRQLTTTLTESGRALLDQGSSLLADLDCRRLLDELDHIAGPGGQSPWSTTVPPSQ